MGLLVVMWGDNDSMRSRTGLLISILQSAARLSSGAVVVALAMVCGCTKPAARTASSANSQDPKSMQKLVADEALTADALAVSTPLSIESVEKNRSAFELRLKNTVVDATALVEGAVVTPASTKHAYELTLIWVDGAGRVMGEYNVGTLAVQAKTPDDQPIPFKLPVPPCCAGQEHRLALMKFEHAADVAPVMVAQTHLVVHAPQKSDDYSVFVRGNADRTGWPPKLWSAFKQIGVSGVECAPGAAPTACIRRGLTFYSNLIGPDENMLRPAVPDVADYAQYKTTRDPEFLKRHSGLFDENAVAKAMQQIDTSLAAPADFDAAFVSLGDGLGLSSPLMPMDTDMSPATLAVYRAWLRQRYGTLPALNDAWGMSYSDWSQVEPPTTDAALATMPFQAHSTVVKPQNSIGGALPEPLAAPTAGHENAAAWCDFRSFNDFAFARLVREFRRELIAKTFAPAVDPHAAPPDPRLGLFGVQEPGVLNGWDPAQLGRSLDWAEEHDAPCAREMLRSFAPWMRWVSCVSGHKPSDIHTLWDRWLRGDSACVIDADALLADADAAASDAKKISDKSKQKNKEKDSPAEESPLNTALAAEVTALRDGMSRLLLASQQIRDPIAIYYSPRSMQVNWLLDCGATDGDWLDSAAGRAQRHSGLSALRSWSALLEDLGYTPSFVNPQQLLAGALESTKTRVLVLPRVIAISDEETAAIQVFARNGGVVIADGGCGTFDGFGKRRAAIFNDSLPLAPLGALDAAFGIARKGLGIQVVGAQFIGDSDASRVTMREGNTDKPCGPSAADLRVLEPGVTALGSWRHGSSAGGAAALLTKAAGLGRFIYLNLCVNDYAQLRLQPEAEAFSFTGMSDTDYEQRYGKPTGGEALRLIAADMLSAACPPTAFHVWNDSGAPVRDIRRARYIHGKDHRVYGLLPNSNRADDAEKALDAWVGDDIASDWYDIRNGAFLGSGKAVKVRIDPQRATVLVALPYKAERMSMKVRRLDPRGRFSISATLVVSDGEPGDHIFHVEVADAKGAVLPAYSQNILAPSGHYEYEMVLGLNEPSGGYHIRVRDVETGTTGLGELRKEVMEYPGIDRQ